MRCPSCQIENDVTRKFCRECGNKLMAICHECKAENALGDKFCGECGYDLTAQFESTATDYARPKAYTPKFLADKILTNRSVMEGERKLVTVLFADVADFTSLSEKLDPEDVHQIMDGCFSILMERIHQHEGTVNQFTGDGVMALFGAPLAHEDHAQRACHTALALRQAVLSYAENVGKGFGVDFKMRFGLNSGPVIVGSIGDDLRMDYTAVGDTTNLAARMQSLASPGTILASYHTQKLAKEFFEFKPLGLLEVKGKSQPQASFELIGPSQVATRIEAAEARGLTPFVGRKNSMAALTDAYAKATSGSGQVVGIVGEAGVGKSRLLLEFEKRLKRDEHVVLKGHCLHCGASMPYLPVLDILRAYFGIQEGEGASAIRKKIEKRVLRLDAGLVWALPPFQGLLSLTVEDQAHHALDSKRKKEKAFEAIRNLIIGESRKQMVVMVVEDLHWIDKMSEEFINYLIARVINARFMLVLLYRPEYTHPWKGKSFYKQISLSQLTTQSSISLVRSILRSANVDSELERFILTRSYGNPLFIEEFIRALFESGTIKKKNSKYFFNSNVSDFQVPETIHGVIAARIDRLEESLKRILQMAAVIGREFTIEILQTITRAGAELKNHLLILQQLEFIYHKGYARELKYVFKHALVQEVAYKGMLVRKRNEIHHRIGQAIEGLYSHRLEEFYEMLAYHYSKTDDTDKAYCFSKASGEKAAKNYSNWEAYLYYKSALEIYEKKPASRKCRNKQLDVLNMIIVPMRLMGYPEGSLQMMQKGAKLSKEVADHASLAVFNSRMGHYFTIKEGRPRKGIQYSLDSFRGALKERKTELVAKTGWDLCVSYNIAGYFKDTPGIAAKVISLLERVNKEQESFGEGPNIYSAIHGHYGWAMGELGDFDKGQSLFEKAIGFTSQIDNIASLGLIEFLYGYYYMAKEDGSNTIKRFRNSIEYLERAKYMTILGHAWSGIGAGYLLLGEPEEARNYVEKGLKMQTELAFTYRGSLHFLLLGKIYFQLGDLKKAQKYFKEALRLSLNSHVVDLPAIAKIWIGKILAKNNMPESKKAKDLIVQGIQTLKKLKLKLLYAKGYFFLAEIYKRENMTREALENLNIAEKIFQELYLDNWKIKAEELHNSIK